MNEGWKWWFVQEFGLSSLVISCGESIKQLAAALRISQFTIRDYVQSAIRKMGVQHRSQAVAEAIRQGIID